MPLPGTQIIPGELHQGLCLMIAEINNNQVALFIAYPSPGNQILVTPVVRPTPSVTQLPFAFAKDWPVDGFQEPSIERPQILIDRFFRTSAEKHRRSYLSSFELPLMKQLYA